MSIHKSAGEAMMRGNHFVDRTVTEKGTEYGWLLRQVEWVQQCIVIYSEEKKEMNTEELERLEELRTSSGAMTHPSKLPTAGSLRPVLGSLGVIISTRRVQVLFLEKDDGNAKDCGVLTWFAGTVIITTDVEGGIEASLEWDRNFNNEEDKTTLDQLLSSNRGENQWLDQHSWKLAEW